MSKGRNKELIALRNQRIFERYHYWTEVVRLRFDDTIRKLSEEEFFLSEFTILQVVRTKLTERATVSGQTIPPARRYGFRLFPTRAKSLGEQYSLFPSDSL